MPLEKKCLKRQVLIDFHEIEMCFKFQLRNENDSFATRYLSRNRWRLGWPTKLQALRDRSLLIPLGGTEEKLKKVYIKK